MKHLHRVFLSVLMMLCLMITSASYVEVYADDTGETNEEAPEPTCTTTAIEIPAPTEDCQLYYNGVGFEYYADGSTPTKNRVGLFTTDYGGGFCFCGSAGLLDPMKTEIGASVSFGPPTKIDDPYIRKILYYGFSGPAQWSGFETVPYDGPGFTTNNEAAITNLFGSARMGAAYNATHDVLSATNSGIRRDPVMTAEFRAYLETVPEPPSTFVVYERIGTKVTQDVFVWKSVTTGQLKLVKSSTDPGITDGNSCYSLAGTTYTVYTDPNGTNAVGTLVCDENGNSNTLTLSEGTYYYKETVAGKGYKLDTSGMHSVTIPGSSETTITAQDVPGNDPAVIRLFKSGAEGSNQYDFSGTQFKVEYFNAYYDTVEEARAAGATRTWTIETKPLNGAYVAALMPGYIVDGSDDMYQMHGVNTLPLGTVVIEETKAAQGMLNDGVITDLSGGGGTRTYLAQIRQDSSAPVLTTTNGVSIQTDENADFNVIDSAIRGDFSFVKTASAYDQTLAGVEFELKEESTGKTFTIKTNEDGRYDSSTDETVWTGNETKTKGLGHLVFGKYTLTELSCEANAAYELAEPVTFSITENGSVIDLGKIDNHKPTISTVLLSKDQLHEVMAEKDVELIDTVTYKDFVNHTAKTLLIKGRLMDAETKKDALDDEGDPITAEVEVVPEESGGSANLTYHFNAASLAGKSFVSFVSVEEKDTGKVLTKEEDFENEDQRIIFPKIGTTLSEETSSSHAAKPEKIVLSDQVSYENVIPGKEYLVEGELYSKDTGKSLGITAKTLFTPKEKHGIVELIFEVDAQNLSGQTIVAFETLSGGPKLAIHADLNDESQSVHVVPELKTTATSKGEKTVLATQQKVAITDVVEYKNLPSGTYELSAVLMDAQTNKAVPDAAATLRFDVNEGQPDGTVNIDIEFAPQSLEGHDVVVFEKLYVVGDKDQRYEISRHEDIKDKGQTISVVQPIIPKTGENNSMLFWICLCGATLLGVVIVLLIKQKRA